MAEDSGSSNQQSLQMVPISEPIIPETEVSLYGKDDVNGGGDMTSLPLFDTKGTFIETFLMPKLIYSNHSMNFNCSTCFWHNLKTIQL